MDKNVNDEFKKDINKKICPLIAEAFILYDAALSEHNLSRDVKLDFKQKEALRLKAHLDSFIDQCVMLDSSL